MYLQRRFRKMKKLLVLIVCLFLGACAVAEGNGPVAQPEESIAPAFISGGWMTREDATLSEEDLACFEKGMSGLVGVSYEPLLCLATQVVAGTNTCYLCRATVVYPNAVPYYALVYLYQNLEGEVSVLDIQQLEIGVH